MFSQLSLSTSHLPAPVRLSRIVNDVHVVQMSGPWDADLAGITTDSRAVRDRWVFVALEGGHVDGHAYVQRAIEQGAACVVVQEKQYVGGLRELLTAAYSQHNATTVIVTPDTRAAVAVLADRFYGSPASKLVLAGITGTNGKTTTSMLVESVLRTAGHETGLIGTVEYRIGKSVVPAPFTTPPAEELHRVLAQMVTAGCTHAVMEVSSHALALERVHGLRFAASVFTNLTQDHLDFHGDMEQYAAAKELLFARHTEGTGVINADDAVAARMLAPLGRRRMTYGTGARASIRIKEIAPLRNGMRVVLATKQGEVTLRTALSGRFNAWNIAAAFGACRALGIDDATIVRGIAKARQVPGRFERIRSSDGVTAIVDYAHTPDALEHALLSARALAGDARVLVVFGCGGDRDQGKRPIMGAVAARLADMAIVTSDNPRSEDPDAIISSIIAGAEAEIATGAGQSRLRSMPSRRAAIRKALGLASVGDVVLVAGKGHEDYQILGTRRVHFDDREEVRTYFTEKRGGVR